MSIKIGINGTASFNALKDLIVGTSATTKKDVNRVEDWNGTIIWQRVTAVELTALNTRFSLDTRECSKTNSDKYWSYTCKPEPYKSSYGDGHIEYYNGTSWITLTENTDYTVRWTNNSGRLPTSGTTEGTVSATGKAWIEGMGAYSGSFSRDFTITYTYNDGKIDITNNCDIYLAEDSRTITNAQAIWEASEEDLTINVSYVYLSSPFTRLTLYTDYTVSYSYPTDKKYTHTEEGTIPKDVTVTITGNGKYKGTKTKTYKVYHKYELVRERVYMTWYRNLESSSVSTYGMDIHTFKPGSDSINTVTIAQSDDNITGTAYGNGINVVISGNTCKWSLNQTDWTTADTGLGHNGTICFTNGKFVICGGDSKNSKAKYAAVSSDGKTWTKYSMGNDDHGGYFTASCGNGNTIVSVTSISTYRRVFKSTDCGQTWSMATQPSIQFGDSQSQVDIVCIRYINGYFICNADSAALLENAFCHMKVDSDTYFTRAWSGSMSGYGVLIGASNSTIVIPMVGLLDPSSTSETKKYYNGVIYSTDYGATWTANRFLSTTTGGSRIKSVNYINGNFYALDSLGNSSWRVYSSPDGITWSLSTTASSTGYYVREVS